MSTKLNKVEQDFLLKLARNSIASYLHSRKKISAECPAEFSRLLEKRGIFVTLRIDGMLRGCIGNIMPVNSIVKGVIENAVNAAFRDPRFPPLANAELSQAEIEISILTEPQQLTYNGPQDLLAKVTENDGVIISSGEYSATFLPQVWEELNDKEEFFSHLCEKAGLDEDEWEKGKLKVEVYQVESFSE